MNRIGHIVGLVFATILLIASKAFLLSHPIASAGFLLLASLFYIVCTVASKRALFLYPVMFFGALAYYLGLYGIGVSYIWYPAHSFILISLLAVAKHVARKKGQESYFEAFRKGISTTVIIFTFWALSFAKANWAANPMVYVLAFSGYAIFYFSQSRLNPERKALVYRWVYFGIAGFLALAGMQLLPSVTKSITLAALIFALAYVAVNTHKTKGYAYALPFLSGLLISSLFSFIYSFNSWNAMSLTLLFNSIASWFVYKSMKEAIVGTRISTSGEKFFMTVFRVGFMLLPVIFLGALLSQGFSFSYLNIVLSLFFAWSFAKFTRPPYKSLFKARNHYVYLSGAFATALVYLVLFTLSNLLSKDILFLFTPLWIVAILSLAGVLEKKKDTVRANSLVDVSFLTVAINAVLLVSSKSFNPTFGLILFGLTALVLFVFLAISKNRAICYSLSLVIWFGLYGVLSYIGVSVQIFSLAYLSGALLFAGAAYVLTKDRKPVANVFSLSLLLFSLTALCFSAIDGVLWLIVLSYMAIAFLSVGAVRSCEKGTEGLYSRIGHLAAIVAIVNILSNRMLDQSIYVILSLMAGYFLPFILHKKERYAFPAGILGCAGYLLFLIRVCPPQFIMLAYLPLTAIFLFKRKSQAALISAYFSSAAVALWVLTAGSVSPLFVAFSSLLYGVAFVVSDRRNIAFTTTALSFFVVAMYFLSKVFLPVEQALIFSGVITFIFFIAGVVLGKKDVFKVVAKALIISGISLLFIFAIISVFAGMILATKALIVLSSLVFILAALIFKQEIFLYLLTLNISILFFNFVQTSGSVFTQDLFIYVLYGVILIGMFFVIPYIKQLKKYDRVFMMFTIANWKGILFYSIPVSIILLITLMLYSVKITEHPQFCSSCHYMDDYVKSWEHSDHKDVKCVDCHYEPGVKAIAVGKIEGLVQLVKYMTHTYGSKPWAEVRDTSCLREGCHDKMDRKKPVLFEKGIQFSHSTHLDNPVKEHTLRCTTCHGQSDDEAEHLSVTKSACFVCHFKSNEKKTSNCATCHGIPDSHTEFVEDVNNVDCMACHDGITEGTGKVETFYCLFCHGKKDIRKKISAEEIHAKHVTDKKVECFQCHGVIKHGPGEGI